MDDSSEHRDGELVVLIGGDRVPKPTGVRGLWSPLHQEFYVPFLDEQTAEEVGRIVTGQLRREGVHS